MAVKRLFIIMAHYADWDAGSDRIIGVWNHRHNAEAYLRGLLEEKHSWALYPDSVPPIPSDPEINRNAIPNTDYELIEVVTRDAE